MSKSYLVTLPIPVGLELLGRRGRWERGQLFRSLTEKKWNSSHTVLKLVFRSPSQKKFSGKSVIIRNILHLCSEIDQKSREGVYHTEIRECIGRGNPQHNPAIMAATCAQIWTTFPPNLSSPRRNKPVFSPSKFIKPFLEVPHRPSAYFGVDSAYREPLTLRGQPLNPFTGWQRTILTWYTVETAAPTPKPRQTSGIFPSKPLFPLLLTASSWIEARRRT